MPEKNYSIYLYIGNSNYLLFARRLPESKIPAFVKKQTGKSTYSHAQLVSIECDPLENIYPMDAWKKDYPEIDYYNYI